jgi:hypothetical protein
LRQYQDEYNRVEQEKQDAVISTAQAALQESLAARRSELAATIFTAPSAELESRCTQAENITGTVQEIRAQVHRAFDEWLSRASDEGLTIYPSGLEKLRRAAAANTRVDFRDPQSFCELFDVLEALSIFTSQDRTLPERAPSPEVGERPRDLESLDTSTQQGRSEAARLMLAENQSEAASHFASFAAQIQRDFNYTLDPQETESLCSQMRVMNRSWTNQRAWSDSRRELVKKGLLPQNLLTPSEKLDELIETTPNTWQGRQFLKTQERFLNAR